jgi:hypothetical protein
VVGIDYTPEHVRAIRDQMILLRGHAMADGELGWAITLSWVIAYLAEYNVMLETMGRAS